METSSPRKQVHVEELPVIISTFGAFVLDLCKLRWSAEW